MQIIITCYKAQSQCSIKHPSQEQEQWKQGERGNAAISSSFLSKDKIKHKAWKLRSEAPIWQCACPVFCPIFPVQSYFNCSSGATGNMAQSAIISRTNPLPSFSTVFKSPSHPLFPYLNTVSSRIICTIGKDG